ncbi:hypothetical protein ABK040_010922 [Willaertia magna]
MLNNSQWNSVLGLDLTLTAIFEFLPNGPDFMNLVNAIKDKEIYKQLINETARYGIWNKRTVFIDDLSKEESKKLLKFLIEEIISQKKHFEIPQIKLCVKSSVGDSDSLIKDENNYLTLENTLIETHCSQLQKLNLKDECCAYKNRTFDNVIELTLNTGSAKEIQGRFPHVEKLVVSYFSFGSDNLKLETVKELTVKSSGFFSFEEVPLAELVKKVIAVFPNLTKFTISDGIVKYMYSYNIVDTKKDPVAVSKREIDILEFQYPEIKIAENKLKNITIIHSKEANKVVLHGLKRELQMLCPSTLIDLKAGNGKSYSFYDWNLIKDTAPVELYKLHEEICKLEMSDTTNVLQNEFIGKFIACAYPIDSKAYVPRLMVLLNQLTNLFSTLTHYTEDVVNKQRETLEIYLSLIGKHDDFSQELERNINNLELITKKYGKGLFKDLKLTSQDKEAIVEIINNIKVVTNQIYDKGHSLYPNEKLFIKEEWHSDNFIECFDGLDDEGIEIEVEENVTFDELEDSFDEESEEEECDEEIDSLNSTLSKRSFESMEQFEANKKIKI